MFLCSKKHRILYIETPKCASTTVIQYMLRIHGIHTKLNPRKFVRKRPGELAKAGLFRASFQSRSHRQLKKMTDGFFCFSVVRDPYLRTISNYRNKLNRYGACFHRIAYYKGKVSQLLAGPSAWSNPNAASSCIANSITFEDFVAGLSKHGTDFDQHYWPLTKILNRAPIHCNKILKMENLHSDLIALNTELNARDVPCNLGMLGDRLNQSTSSRTPVEHWYDSITEQQVYVRSLSRRLSKLPVRTTLRQREQGGMKSNRWVW